MAFMVEGFGFTGSQLGFYVGILASSFGFGQICSAIIWGGLSDRYGRKPVVIFGTMAAGVAMLIFGSAQGLAQAILGRFLGGFLSGNLGVLKCVLTESTDETNRVEGFGVISVAWFTGCIISPLVGGILSGLPKDSSGGENAGLFVGMYFELISTYPYLLPCLFCFTCNLFATILTIFCLTETRWKHLNADSDANNSQEMQPLIANTMHNSRTMHGDHHSPSQTRSRSNSSSSTGHNHHLITGLMSPKLVRANSLMRPQYMFDISDVSPSKSGGSPSLRSRVNSRQASTDNLHGNVEKYNYGSHDTAGGDVIDVMNVPMDAVKTEDTPVGRSTMELLKDNTVRLVCANYGVLLCATIFMDETIPLFLKQRHEEGGFEFSMKSIGVLLSCTGVISLVFLIYVLPIFNQYKKQSVYYYSALLLIPCVMLWPMAAYFYYHFHVDNNIGDDSDAMVYGLTFLLGSTNIIRNCLCALTFTIVMIQVNNSVETYELGVVNGLGQLVASIARCIGPVVGGFLWSVSTSFHFLFLNFIIISILIGISIVINNLLPPSLENSKEMGDAEEEAVEKNVLP